jgi:hypothetical protein
MRRFPFGWAILILSVITVVVAFRVHWSDELSRMGNVRQLSKAPSQIYAHMLVHYDKPPIYEEEYRMKDIEGVSSFQYRIRGYNGRQITITAQPREVYDVSFFFGSLGEDGVWQLMNQPPRGNTDVHYTIYVKQLADFQQGDRTITFTDPRYWATAAGRQYQIDLSKQNPNDLLKLSSTQLANPHYEAVVRDFRDFGPPTFRQKIAAAQATIRAGK